METKLIEKIGFTFIFIIVVIGVYLSHTNLDFYQSVYTREDGFVEWLTVIALLLGSFTAFYRAKVLAKFRNPLFITGLVIMGLLFFFGAGEEVSWGQRIFKWTSPSFFHNYNSQGETNFHNLVVGETKINKLVFGLILGIIVGFYFLILPFLYKKIEKVQKLIDRFAIPIPKIQHILAYLILFALTRFIAGHKPGEILEFGGCWIFYLMTLEPLNRDLFSRKSFIR